MGNALQEIREILESIAPEIRQMSGSSREKLRRAYKLSKTAEEPESSNTMLSNLDLPLEDRTSLASAKHKVFSNLHTGSVCPCCEQYAKRYIKVEGWIDLPETAPRFVIKSNEIGKLQHWGLVEQRPSEDTSQKTSGIWRPTEKGIDFARRKIQVSSHVFLYNNIVRDWSDEMVGIDKALGSKFNYSELMES